MNVQNVSIHFEPTVNILKINRYFELKLINK